MQKKITIKGARVHNLKNIDLEIPREKLIVFTGISGSGKSSLAFDTIYAEGQRRYVESLSTYARQFLGLMDKPEVDSIEGLSPAISIDQRSASTNPRSTVGTVTEIYDYLRLLYSRIGHVHCPYCGTELSKDTTAQVVAKISAQIKGNKKGEIVILAPVIIDENNSQAKSLTEIKNSGFNFIRYNDSFIDLRTSGNVLLKGSRAEIVAGEISYTSDKFETNKDEILRLTELAFDLGNGQVIILVDGIENFYSQRYFCRKDNFVLADLEPRNFSFNSPAGACSKCLGLGSRLEVDPDLVITNKRLTLAQGAIKPWARNFSNQAIYQKLLSAVAKSNKFSLDVSVEELSSKSLDIILYGTGDEQYEVDGEKMKFPGVIEILTEKHQETTSDYLKSEIEQYMRETQCPFCKGKRLKQEYLAVTFGGKNISEVTAQTVEKNLEFFKSYLDAKKGKENISAREQKIVGQVLKEIASHLHFLGKVGLNYLTLDRPAATLAGGEAQRIRLATQLGMSLTGVVYVLDEPSIGLHQQDNKKLIETILHLRDLGNTVIVVEHDEMTMEIADLIVDIGPGAGENGGKVVAVGTPAEIKKNKNSLTGRYLSGNLKIQQPKQYRKGNGKVIEILGASEFNLKDVDAKIPLGKFICLTGASGSGKSTIMLEILVKALNKHFYRSKDLPGKHKEIKGLQHIDKVIAIDQSPIGRTPRSNPATYTGVFTYIRDLFTQTQEAKIRGYKAGKFSFNAKAGRCETCGGEGMVKIEMQFLPDVYVQCEECHGARYKQEVLEVHYQGYNIADILNMSVEQAMKFFVRHPNISSKLKTLYDVGLGYIKLGQPATTLSGGEAQRVKLSTELSRRSTGKTLYILDEPTTGLHFEDIKQLLGVLNKLVDKGNTVLIIEHNLDVIKCADWIIDMGPGGGDKGGYIVAEGTPADIAKNKKSVTGQYLKEVLK